MTARVLNFPSRRPLPKATFQAMVDSSTVHHTADGPLLEIVLTARLAEPEWRTTFYLQALETLGCLEREEGDAFASHLGAMRERVFQAWEAYAQTPLLDEEVTAESTAGHRVLREGLEGWLVALDRLEAAARGEADILDALDLAEASNRLLVALQRQSRHLLASSG